MGYWLADGASESYFDSVYNDVVCPNCGHKWQEEIGKGFGYSTIDLECEDCDAVFTHVVETYFGD